jgi:hypothetical protein
MDIAPEATNRLYCNDRDGTFTDVTAKSGLQRSGRASAIAVGDYNNDGFDDLFITYWGQNVLYRNNGDGTFRDVTKETGLLSPGLAGVRAAPLSIMTETGCSTCTWQIISNSTLSRYCGPVRLRSATGMEGHSGALRSARVTAGDPVAVSQ